MEEVGVVVSIIALLVVGFFAGVFTAFNYNDARCKNAEPIVIDATVYRCVKEEMVKELALLLEDDE